MTINSLYFIFLFLPVFLILYYLCPKRGRDIPLVLFSLVFYAWGNPQYLVLLALSVLFNYVSGLEIAEFHAQDRPTAAKVTLIVALAGNLLVLGFFKYYGFLVTNFNRLTGLRLPYTALPLPLGVSFFTFSVLSYIIDVYRRKVPAQRNLLKFTVYVSFFPKIISGPIVPYAEMEPQLTARVTAPAKFGSGVNLFLVGLAKKVLLADNLGAVFSTLQAMERLSVGSAWLGMVLYSLQLYFDFSGYSDMAIGLAKMVGFDFSKNFDHPYRSTSVSEFWRRWHISLGAWFREYVYIPLGGNRCSARRCLLNLSVVWLLTGLWHGAGWNFLLWGIYHGAFVALEKFVIKDRFSRIPKALRICGTTLVVFLGWVLFFSPSLSGAIHYYGQMFGAGHLGLLDNTAKYYLLENLPLLLIACVGCGPMVQRLHQRLAYWKGGITTYLSVALYAALLVLSVAYLLSATYTSFLYVQF